MFYKISLTLLCSLLLTQCASKPTTTVVPSTEESKYTYEEIWQAVYHLTIEFPVHDFSKEEGTLESEWMVDKSQLSRHRFFISLNSDELEFQKIPFFIDIDQQTRKDKNASWKTSLPSQDKEEKIKNYIYEHLKKNRAA